MRIIKLLLLSIGLFIFEPISGSVIYNPTKKIKYIKRLHKKKKRYRFRVKRKINNMSSSVLFWFLFLLTIVFMLLIFGFLMGLKIPVWGMTLYLMFCLLVILFFIVLGIVWLGDKISRMKRWFNQRLVQFFLIKSGQNFLLCRLFPIPPLIKPQLVFLRYYNLY